ncbi:hypothetical protein SK128_016534, partial [Halocaridina rubra]
QAPLDRGWSGDGGDNMAQLMDSPPIRDILFIPEMSEIVPGGDGEGKTKHSLCIRQQNQR